MKRNKEAEVIIKEHRRWTRLLETRWLKKEGNLILTNRRLLFLHKIQSSPDVRENIRRLADAPIESVLNYAFSLNRNNFQIPLSDVDKVGIGIFSWYPSIQVCLNISFYSGRKRIRRTIAFQFIRPIMQTILRPQIAVVIGWMITINRTIKNFRR